MKNYDLDLPSWGPYNKGYMGASHIADRNRGYRFDVNLFPGNYRRNIMIPRDLADCGAKVMECSADASHYLYRYELEWKDRVYIDADFCSDNQVMTITCNFVNDTDNPESLTLNAVMGMQRPTWYRNEIITLNVTTENDTRWLDAVNYQAIVTRQPFAQDGFLLGETRSSGFTNGSCIEASEHMELHYQFDPVRTDCIGIRYRGAGSLSLTIGEKVYPIVLEEKKTPDFTWIPVSKDAFDSMTIHMDSFRGHLDGFSFGKDIRFDDGSDIIQPEITEQDGVIYLRFEEMTYEVRCICDTMILRTLRTDDIGNLLYSNIHNHVSSQLGNGSHCYADLFIRPVFLEPHTSSQAVITIKAPGNDTYPADHTFCRPEVNEEGAPYVLSQRIMYATTLSNIVWPLYTRGKYIAHNTPGRYWDSHYTWDSGFLGLGLTQIDEKRAEDCLNTYLMPVGDIHSPYLMHGTPLPTQILMFSELVNKSGSKELMKKYYPMLRQQHRFFADARLNGKAKQTGLFNTWNIFYNTGWDDYPPQVYMHEHGLAEDTCTMIMVSFTVICAKILKLIAEELGEDSGEYDDDIAFYSEAVNRYGWDEESGYYGYVNHKDTPHILKIDGVNGNMGMDGVYPYIAGISTPERSRKIVENIKAGLFTPYGASVVDTRAPYYRKDGYWNGSIWMPHQWILWKGFLDNGQLEEALTISDIALRLWKRETDLTYNCYEHFMIQNGRGAGFHQFSGLSSPVLMWFHALYKPFTVSCGFQTLITDKKKENDIFSFHVDARGFAPLVLVCLPEGKTYDFHTSGSVKQINKGTYCIFFGHPIKESISIGLHK